MGESEFCGDCKEEFTCDLGASLGYYLACVHFSVLDYLFTSFLRCAGKGENCVYSCVYNLKELFLPSWGDDGTFSCHSFFPSIMTLKTGVDYCFPTILFLLNKVDPFFEYFLRNVSKNHFFFRMNMRVKNFILS